MAHEILSVKLYELDKKIGQVHSRIQLSETASREQVRVEIESLRSECRESALTLQNKLRFSKGKVAGRLCQAYDKVEQIIRQTEEELSKPEDESRNAEVSAEEKILFAEYALDFAVQAANRALLTAMEALDAQMTQQDREEKKQ